MKKIDFLFIGILISAAVLRLCFLDKYPPGLYSDEAAYGYNAFSLLETGRDEFGKNWPISFKSFGDYKPAMSAWLIIPFIKIFGVSDYSIRLPSALLGLLTVFGVFLLSKEIFEEKKNKFFKYLPYLCAILLAVNPWHILFSRSSMLVSIEATFILFGFLFFLKAIKKPQFFFLSALSFCAAIYSYYGSRVTVPLLIITLAFNFKNGLGKVKKQIAMAIILGAVSLSPLLIAFYKDPLVITGRAKTVSIFYDPGIKLKLWEAHTLDGSDFPVVLSRFFHNKFYFYFRDFLKRYVGHFSFGFLFVNGDKQIPFDLPRYGLLYLVDIPFFLYGLFLMIKYRTQKRTALVLYLFLSPVVSSFSFLTPAANRSFNMVVPWVIISAFGIIEFLNRIHVTWKNWVIGAIGYLYVLSFVHFLFIYTYLVPMMSPASWHYGRQELVQKIFKYENNFDKVFVPNDYGPAYIWLLLYKNYPPQTYLKEANINDVPDELGFVKVNSFAKYQMVNNYDWEKVEKSGKHLYIGFEEQIPDFWYGIWQGKIYKVDVLDKVVYPNGKIAFKLIKVNLVQE